MLRGKKKVLHFVRHAQAMHNPKAEALKKNGCTFEQFLNQMTIDDAFDAPLTQLGVEQASSAGGSVCPKKIQQVQLIVSSPLTRCIKTAQLVLPPHTLNRPHVLMEEWREISGLLLNAKRRPASELQAQFPTIDCSQLSESDELWTEVLEEKTVCAERAYQGLKRIWEREEENIVVVAHGGIFDFMMNHHPNIHADEAMSMRFGNCEIRSCQLTIEEGSGSGDDTSGDGSPLGGDVDITLTRLETDFLVAGSG